MGENVGELDLPEELGELEDLVAEVREALETAEATEEVFGKLDDLEGRIREARENPERLNGETYTELFVDLAMLLPENLPLSDAAKKALEAAARVLGLLLGAALEAQLARLFRDFRRLVEGGYDPEEAAKAIAGVRQHQLWLLWRWKSERLRPPATSALPPSRSDLLKFAAVVVGAIAIGAAVLVGTRGGASQSQPPVQDQAAASEQAPVQVGFLMRSELFLGGIDVLPGQGYQGRIRVVVRDRQGVPVADARVFIRTEKSDGARTTAEGVTNANGYVVFGMRTTQPGTNALFITNIERSGYSWEVFNTPLTWEATAPSAPPALLLSCDHRLPGVESDIIIRGENLAPGQTVSGQVSGPGVVGNGRFSATVGTDGRFEARVPINRFGAYNVTVASLSSTINVGATCPG